MAVALTLPQQSAKGSLLILTAMACFATSDALVKLFTAGLSAFEIAWIRYIVLLLTVLTSWLVAPGSWRSKQPLLQIVRAVGLIGSAVFFLQGLRYLPIAEATAIVFVSPLFVTLLAIGILGEKVALHRWWPVALGSAGVLLVVQPGGEQFGSAALFPVMSSLCWATAVICTRKIGNRDSAATTMLYSSIVGVGFLTAMLPPASADRLMQASPWCLVMAAAWCSGQWLAIAAYRIASASVIAPFAYSQLLWSALLGFSVWRHVPDHESIAGICLILSGGLCAAWQNRRTLPR